jgi:hypothetical protein
MKRRIVGLLLPVVFVAACGGDDEVDPKEACSQMVDAFTNAWVRCGKDPAFSRKTWTDAFSGCNPNSVDRAKLDQCKSDLTTADCNIVTSGSPASCNGVLGQ